MMTSMEHRRPLFQPLKAFFASSSSSLEPSLLQMRLDLNSHHSLRVWEFRSCLALAGQHFNFFGAITVLLDRPFKVGDWVIIGSAEGESRNQSSTTLVRTSSIRSSPFLTDLVSIPVENWKRRWRRWQSMIHLDINSDPEKVEAFVNVHSI